MEDQITITTKLDTLIKTLQLRRTAYITELHCVQEKLNECREILIMLEELQMDINFKTNRKGK